MILRLDANVAWEPWVALGWLIALLAAYVALDLSRRVPAARPGVARRWLAAAALALGTGLWSAQVIVLAAQRVPFPVGFHPWGALASWVLAVGVGLVAMAVMASATAGPGRKLAGVAALALGTVATQIAVVASAGLRPAIEWPLVPLIAAVLCAAVGGAGGGWALGRFARGLRAPQHLAVAFGWALTLALSQWLVSAAAELPARSFSAHDQKLSDTTLAVLASVGSVALLLVMLVASMLEWRMRASLGRAKDELERRTFTDLVTDLPTRAAFDAQMAAAVQRADRKQTRLALLHVGLDSFKPINESFDRDIGDRMLSEVADRLRALTRPHDRVARLGGDEFLMLLSADPDKDTAARMAASLLEAIARPCKLDGREASVTCSIGIALYPEHGAVKALFTHAEAAMRAAKGGGGATYAFFEAHMMNGARDQAVLLRDLRGALAKGQLELVYQPKVHGPSGAITGAEALMRWHHPERGLVSPAVFIPIAERFGLIGTLGLWVIDEACRQARAWRDQGLRMRVAINLSAQQLRQPELIEHIATALQRHQVNPQLLTCEMTESVAMEYAEGTTKIFEKLAHIGVHLSIDDFGTGYSSLSQLRKLPAEELKIDRSFVLDLETSAEARAVVDAVIKLAQALGKKVVAEGVETDGQYQFLRSLGCDEMQGYLFHKPMSARALGLLAMDDMSPRSVAFRDSLFRETLPTALH